MGSPARFPAGVTNASPEGPLAQFGLPDPTSWHVFFDDFDTFNTSDWTITTTEAGAGDATEALTDIDGGALLITNDAADDDADFFQKKGESFLLAAGKRAVFKARFKVSDATQSDFVMGLQITDTTPLAVSDGIWFQKDDGDANLDVYCGKSSGAGTTSATAVATVVSDTFLTVAWAYDGKGSVKYYVDDVHKGTLDGSSTYLPDTELTVSFGIQNGEAVAKTMTVDYIFAAKER